MRTEYFNNKQDQVTKKKFPCHELDSNLHLWDPFILSRLWLPGSPVSYIRSGGRSFSVPKANKNFDNCLDEINILAESYLKKSVHSFFWFWIVRTFILIHRHRCLFMHSPFDPTIHSDLSSVRFLV